MSNVLSPRQFTSPANRAAGANIAGSRKPSHPGEEGLWRAARRQWGQKAPQECFGRTIKDHASSGQQEINCYRRLRQRLYEKFGATGTGGGA